MTNQPPTAEELAEWERLAKDTQDLWEILRDITETWTDHDYFARSVQLRKTLNGSRAFIAAARTGWPRTIAALREALKAREDGRLGAIRAFHVTLDDLGAPPDEWPCTRVNKMHEATLRAKDREIEGFRECGLKLRNEAVAILAEYDEYGDNCATNRGCLRIRVSDWDRLDAAKGTKG